VLGEVNPDVEAITQEIFDHLVQLAALDLEPEEASYLRHELNGQLKAIRELEAIEFSMDVPITSHGVPYTATTRLPLRGDEIESCKDADDILGQAPDTEDRYIVTPDLPKEMLE
jgi:aspartyl/glutamyl-tRNA(Asn/Gln) amidotransferase C subunit